MKMGRPKGSKNKTNGGKGPNVETTSHDNLSREPLTDDQHHALVASWVEKYEKLEAVFKTAGANLKNCARAAKAEKVLLRDIRAYQDAGTEEGQAKLVEDAERLARVARWRNFDLGIFEQAEMFGEGEDAMQSRSFVLGREAGMAGKPAKVAPGCDVNEFMAGWQAGQTALGEKTFKQKAADAEEFN